MKRLLSIPIILSASLAMSGAAQACGGGLEFAPPYDPDAQIDYSAKYPDQQLTDLEYALRGDDIGGAEWLIERLPLSEVMAESGVELLHRHLMMSEWEGFFVHNAPINDAKLRVLEAMLEGGADPNAVALAGHTPLMTLALRGEHSAMGARQVDLLIKHGAVVDQTAPGGVTALQIALHVNAPHIAAALLRHGADPALEDDDGISADSLARARGLPDLAAFLPVENRLKTQ